jgi:ubiquinone/menaquinone biosynthesis C-methylase UbiE
MDDPVQAQYEAYPYPARDPRDEARRLVTGSPSELSELNHYLFAGRRDFRRPFRALVAGGGTGDAAIMLGQQLAERGGLGEVVYLDVAATARRTAEARASARGLTNISFVTGALQDLPDLGLGRFDYIDCCGVLHHLEDPTAGLGALAAVLDERGGMGLMLYGEYGRTGVYPMQAMLQGLGRDLPLERKVVLARRLLAALPKTNWLRHNRHLLVRSAELEIVAFIEPARYEPTTYLGDPVVLEQLEGLGQLERAGFAEALAGNIKKHLFYAAKRGTSQGRLARPDRPEAVPVLGRLPAARLAEALRREAVLKVDLDGVALSLPMPELAAEMVARIDGKTSLAKLHRALQKGRPAVDWLAFKAAFDSLYEALGGLNHLWIAYPRSDQ